MICGWWYYFKVKYFFYFVYKFKEWEVIELVINIKLWLVMFINDLLVNILVYFIYCIWLEYKCER